MKLPILPTTVIGSYSMPEWLERAKNDYLSRRLSRRDLDEMHDAVRKAAIKDQEVAGIDIVTDGELQRDNMIDYFTERLPGVQVDLGSKRFYYDFYESVVRSKLATGSLGLVEEVRFLKRFTRARAEDLGLGAAHARQAHPQPVLSRPRRRSRSTSARVAELRAEGAGARRRDRAADRRAVLLRLPRGSAVGRQGDQRRGRRRGRARHAAHLLRQPLRQAVVRGQLPVSVPDDSRGQGARRSRSSSRAAARKTWSCSGSSRRRSRSASASSTSRRRTSSRRRSSPIASAARSKSCRPSAS